MVSANPMSLLARAETFVEVYQSLMSQLEIEMDALVSGGDDTQEESALLRTSINQVRALIGFWRTEVSFWRNEVNENKAQIKETNKLSQAV